MRLFNVELREFVNIFHSSISDDNRFDKQKGFFCQIVGDDKTKCLGRGKGRRYPDMDSRSQSILRSFYHRPNVALSKLLGRLGLPVPDWLTEELSDWR